MLTISVHISITAVSSKTRPRWFWCCWSLSTAVSPLSHLKQDQVPSSTHHLLSAAAFSQSFRQSFIQSHLHCWGAKSRMIEKSIHCNVGGFPTTPFLPARGKIFNILLRFYRAENIGKLENYWITRGQIIGDENLWSSILDWGGYEGLAIWEIVNSFIVVAARCSGKEPHWSDEWDRSLSLFCDAAMRWHQRKRKGRMIW